MADAQDLEAIAAGDAAAVAALYGALAPRLFAFARRLLPVQADAEECVQEVFVSLVERSRRGEPVQDAGAYLFASLRHAVGARARRGERLAALHARAAPAEEPRIEGPGPEARALARALQALPQEQREVVALKVDGELTFAEIGVVLGVGLNTAASRYRYALEKLRKALEEPAP